MTDRFDPVLAIGLMSGTSLDGVDAVLMRTDGATRNEVVHTAYLPYDAAFKADLAAVARTDVALATVLRVEKTLTEKHAQAVEQLLAGAGVPAQACAVVGFHGQTIRHLPDEGLTWQIGNPSLLAERVRVPVVADFRRRDMAAGGQGAPLVPLYHAALMAAQDSPTLVLNLGGVANVTWLGPAGAIIAGDVGPGCGLIDRWAEEHTGTPMDCDGQLARRGRVHHSLLAQFMREVPFFQKLLPKSADRYDFDAVDVRNLGAADGAATLCALTAEAAFQAVAALPALPKTVWVTGGGVHHPVIMAELRARFGHAESVETLGLRPDSMEAECFAWLAVRHQRGLPFTRPETTGCRHETVGGVQTVRHA